MRTALDTNVISALWSTEPTASNILSRLAQAHAVGGLVICAPVYIELLAYPSASHDFVNEFISSTNIVIDFDLDEAIWRQAGQGFAAYAERRRRSAGGNPKRLISDFVIGAHAQLRADRLMTLDSSRYERDFPRLRMI